MTNRAEPDFRSFARRDGERAGLPRRSVIDTLFDDIPSRDHDYITDDVIAAAAFLDSMREAWWDLSAKDRVLLAREAFYTTDTMQRAADARYGEANAIMRKAPTPMSEAERRLAATRYGKILGDEEAGDRLAKQLEKSLRRNGKTQQMLHAVAHKQWKKETPWTRRILYALNGKAMWQEVAAIRSELSAVCRVQTAAVRRQMDYERVEWKAILLRREADVFATVAGAGRIDDLAREAGFPADYAKARGRGRQPESERVVPFRPRGRGGFDRER